MSATERHDTAAPLIRMANDIANYFHSEENREVAIDGIVNHIQRFWEPRMRAKMRTHLNAHGGDGLNELALAAMRKLIAVENQAA